MTDCFVNWTMILRYLGVFLSWPAVALYLGAAVLIRYHEAIAKILGDLQLRKAGPFEFGIRPQGDVKDPDETKREVIQNATGALAGHEMRAEVGAIGVAGAAPAAVVAAPDELANFRRAVEVAAIWLHFERSLNLVFGSQLEFLKALRMRPAGIGAVEVIATFYAEHQKLPPQHTAPFDRWIGWLVMIGFVQETAPASASWALTGQGTQFFTYTDFQYRFGLPFRVG